MPDDDAKMATASLFLELTLSGHGLPVPPGITFWVDDNNDGDAEPEERVHMEQEKDRLVWKGGYELKRPRPAKGIWIAVELRAVTIGEKWSLKATNEDGETVGKIRPQAIGANVVRGWLGL